LLYSRILIREFVLTGNSRVEDVVRPGVCPAPPSTPGPCMTQCRQDGDCPVTEKCCFNGCGRTCRPIAEQGNEKINET